MRAGTLLRLGRNEKKFGHQNVALKPYAELFKLGDVMVEGLPAEMAAREARCRLYEQARRVTQLAAEAAAITQISPEETPYKHLGGASGRGAA